MTRKQLHWLRRGTQLVFLALFLYLFFATALWYIDRVPANGFFRLNPWLALLSMVASRELIPAFLWSAGVVVLTLLLGRVWCGWICPMGTVIELAGGKDRGKLPSRLWAMKYGLMAASLAATLLGSLSLALFDPITILLRALGVSLLPLLDWALTRLEIILYRVEVLQGPLHTFETLTRGRIIPYGEASFRVGAAFLVFFSGILLLNLLRPRFWCRYLCPLGGFLGLLGKFSLVRRQVDQSCINCSRCQRMCPTGAIAGRENGFASDAGECIMCLECQPICPAQAISFARPSRMQPDALYNPSRRGMLASLVGGLGWGLVAKLGWPTNWRFGLPLVRPPGAQGDDFLAKCVRCGECMKVCPTAGLRPSVLEEGLDGFWTPVLVPRLGYCDYACNSCGKVCPTGAIRPLELAEKQETVIGKAHIDETRCLPWAQNVPCLVCEEVCPLPEKAIRIRGGGQGQGRDAGSERVPHPEMIPERCIGCGLCEYKCPVEGESAIRVLSS